MMRNFTEALAAINRLESGVVTDYAIGGAMALVFWSEPIPTFDLDPERVAALLEEGDVDRQLLDKVLARYGLRLPSYE